MRSLHRTGVGPSLSKPTPKPAASAPPRRGFNAYSCSLEKGYRRSAKFRHYFSRNNLLLTTNRIMSFIRYPLAFNFSPSCFRSFSSLYVRLRPVA